MSESENDLEADVRARAYDLWEAAGRPDGRGDEFWHEACAEIAVVRGKAAQHGADPVGGASSSDRRTRISG